MKKTLTLILLTLLLLLSACGNKYTKAAYYEAIKIEKTSTKVNGSQYSSLEIDDEYRQAILDFSFSTASKLLSNNNVMYCPISFYFALSQLAQLTNGKSRDEILDVLLIDNLNTLQDGYNNLFKKLTYINKNSELSFANGLWLNKNYQYRNEPLQLLANKYYSSSYGVDFGDSKTKDIIEEWISDNTGRKLGKGDLSDFDYQTVFVLINTIYFFDEWISKFDKNMNSIEDFLDVGPTTFMNQELSSYYLNNEYYEASYLTFKNKLEIKFILPKSDIGEFVKSEELLQQAFNDSSYLVTSINYKIPKFSYKSSFDLVNFAKTIGITSVFDKTFADFSSLIDGKIFVDKMFQKTYIEIDETGGKAAAFTGIEGKCESAPSEIINFILNRPFIYIISAQDYPLFIGVVNNPNNNDEYIYN